MKKKRDYVGYLMYFLKILVPAIVAVFILRGFFLIPVRVDGHSMQKTLNQGDMIVMEKFSAIKRFDVVVFKTDTGSILIKRVIGLPGDTIAYKDDTLYINGKEVDEPYLDEFKKALTDGQPLTGDFSLKEKVPADSYFVLGDNRRNSKDGRVIGFIHKKDIEGEVKFVMWPFSRFGPIPEVLKQ